MPVDIALDINRDILFEDLNFKLINDQDELRQRLTTRLQVFLGEWWQDVTLGIPYLDKILIKNPLYDTISSLLKREILDTDGIKSLLKFSMKDSDIENRTLDVSFVAKSINDEIIEITGVII